MFRRFTLWGTNKGFNVPRLFVSELWATPFFRTCDFGRKLENLHYIQFVLVRCRFLCLLMSEIDCNYLFNDITKETTFWNKIIQHLEDFQVEQYPKIVTAFCINFISVSENAPECYIITLYICIFEHWIDSWHFGDLKWYRRPFISQKYFNFPKKNEISDTKICKYFHVLSFYILKMH